MRYDRQVVGYHACLKEVADRLLDGEPFRPSRNDCFLVNRYCERLEDDGAPFDTVRGLFQEGDPLIEGSEIRLRNHIQIVARRPTAIVGLFRPRAFTTWAPPIAPEPAPRQADGDG